MNAHTQIDISAFQHHLFTTSNPVPAAIQEAMARVWMAGIPSDLRKKPTRIIKSGPSAITADARAQRDALALEVRRMRIDRNMTRIEIAGALNISVNTCKKIEDENGIPPWRRVGRGQDTVSRSWKAKRDAAAPRVKRLLAAGKTMSEIREVLRCSETFLRRTMREHGLSPNNQWSHARPITFRGVDYPSISAAERATGMDRSTIRRWIANGRG